MALDKVLEVVVKKVEKNMVESDNFPHITESGKRVTTEDGYWTGGFWIGLLWYVYKITGNDVYRREAYKWLERLKERRTDRTFDLGFLFYPSFALGYELTGDISLKEIALKAAGMLSTLFNGKARFIYNKIDGRTGRTPIDVMMNLPLLWWAYDKTRDGKFFKVAYTHSIRTIEEFIREDYSTVHVIDFDLVTGKILRKITMQGYSDDSCWSRGQA